MRLLPVVAAVALLAPACALAAPKSPEAVAAAALKAAPVWDGHNDVPEGLRMRRKNMLAGFDFADTTGTADGTLQAMHTDLARLRKGHVGAQFWSVYVSAGFTDQAALQAVMEQIDVTKRLIAQYPAQMQFAASSADVTKALKAGKIASLLGMEGGYAIANSPGVLRQFHELGVRYMTLTHFKTTSWADSATDAPQHGGLTEFGKNVVREMQRIGMLVDLSHVSTKTMMDALDVAKAPVIFSHSGAQAIDGHPRNVPDLVLGRLKANGGLVMVVTMPGYVSEKVRQWGAVRAAEKAKDGALYPDAPDVAAAALATWEKANPAPRATLGELADHIDHIVKLAGIDHVGLGGDFDGIETTTAGMDDVAGYPNLFVELARRGYGQADLQKIASGNMMRVLKAAETYAAVHKADPAFESPTTY